MDLQILGFCIRNLEFSRFCMSNLENSRFCTSNEILKFQDSASQILKFQNSACQILNFQDSAYPILNFQDSACQIFTFLRATFFRLFRLSLAPFICPWVSEDGEEDAWGYSFPASIVPLLSEHAEHGKKPHILLGA